MLCNIAIQLALALKQGHIVIVCSRAQPMAEAVIPVKITCQKKKQTSICNSKINVTK